MSHKLPPASIAVVQRWDICMDTHKTWNVGQDEEWGGRGGRQLIGEVDCWSSLDDKENCYHTCLGLECPWCGVVR